MKIITIQIPTTFINHLSNIGIEFEVTPENFGKQVLLSLTEKKPGNANPKTWSYTHILQDANLIEFTNVENGNYTVGVKSLTDESIENKYSLITRSKRNTFEKIVNSNMFDSSITVSNEHLGGDSSFEDVLSRHGGVSAFLSNEGSFTLSGAAGNV